LSLIISIEFSHRKILVIAVCLFERCEKSCLLFLEIILATIIMRIDDVRIILKKTGVILFLFIIKYNIITNKNKKKEIITAFVCISHNNININTYRNKAIIFQILETFTTLSKKGNVRNIIDENKFLLANVELTV